MIRAGDHVKRPLLFFLGWHRRGGIAGPVQNILSCFQFCVALFVGGLGGHVEESLAQKLHTSKRFLFSVSAVAFAVD